MKIVVGGLDIANLKRTKKREEITKEQRKRFDKEIEDGKCFSLIGVRRFKRSKVLYPDG